MAYDIGTARGVIEMEYNGRGIDQAQQDLTGLEKGGGNANAALAGTGKAATRAGLAIAAGLGAGVYAAANFEQRMSAINAVSGATGQELDALRQKALQLGKDTQFSASEAASAMEELVKAGLSVDDVLNGAADATVALAAAGEVDMPTAATIASNAMNQFNLAAEDMVKVADNIAGAANASAIDVTDFGQSMQQAGAVANLAGVSFEDTATAIALLGNAGIKGSDAGTSLKSMLSRLQPTTQATFNEMSRLGIITFDTNKALQVLADNGMKNVAKSDAKTALQQLAARLTDSEVGSAKAQKKFQELGLQTGALSNAFYDAKGNTKSLSDISGILSKSLEGMNKRQKQATLQMLFGSDAIRAAAILSNEGSKGFDKMATSMGKVSAADVAAKRMDNFKGSLEEMMGSLETLGITVGTVLLPALRQIVDALTEAFNWFLNLSDGQQKFIAGSLVAAAGILLIVGKLIQFFLWTQRIARALAITKLAFASTWVAALGPIALVIAAIAAVVAIVILLWKKSDAFRAGVLAIWGAIKAAIAAVMSWLQGTFIPFWVNGWNTLVNGVKAAWGFIKSAIAAGIGFVTGIITAGINILKGIWRAAWGTFGPVIKAVWNLIVAIVRLGWTIIKGLFLLYVGALKSIITAGWNVIKAVTSAVWNAITSVIRAVWNNIKGVVMPAVNTIKAIIVGTWTFIKGVTSAMWNALVGVIRSAVGDAVNAVSGLKDRILGFFAGAGSWLYNAGRDIIQGLVDGIASMIGAVTDKINSVTDSVAKFLPGSPVKEGPLKVLNRGHAGKEIIQMVIDGISDMSAPLAHTLDDVITVPTGYAQPAPGSLPAPVRPAEGGAGKGLRLVDGELRLDRSGRAFIRGVAVEADDDEGDFDDLIGRMG